MNIEELAAEVIDEVRRLEGLYAKMRVERDAALADCGCLRLALEKLTDQSQFAYDETGNANRYMIGLGYETRRAREALAAVSARDGKGAK